MDRASARFDYNDLAWVSESSRLLSLFANTERLRLAIAIYRLPNCTVSQLAEILRLRANNVTYLLRALKEEDLVARTKEGRLVRYTITDTKTLDLLSIIINSL